jgi:hypothetical protein
MAAVQRHTGEKFKCVQATGLSTMPQAQTQVSQVDTGLSLYHEQPNNLPGSLISLSVHLRLHTGRTLHFTIYTSL